MIRSGLPRGIRRIALSLVILLTAAGDRRVLALGAPDSPTQELCGNCVDDDGDGLVDYEDPDCCGATRPLTVTGVTLRPSTAPPGGSRLDLNARYAASAPALFEPTAQDTSLQISDPAGETFCATVAAAHWVHPVRRLYRFEDATGAFAGGLDQGQFKVKRDGGVVFRTRGRAIGLGATGGTNLVVTVRVGEDCARDTMSLRTRRNALVFP